MPISTPQDMALAIDCIGNALAIPCSDRTALKYLSEVFSQSAAGAMFESLCSIQGKGRPYFSSQLKSFIVGDCLRYIQYAIYADDVVEDSELDIAYPLIKPLSYFYAKINQGPYARFEHLDRSGVFDFLHTHM